MAGFAKGGYVRGDRAVPIFAGGCDYIISPAVARKFGKELLDRLNEAKREEPDDA